MLSLAVSIAAIWGKVWPVLVGILFFGVIIFIHELGHFVTAKIFKVKVNEFALGMGPAILKKQGKVTKYALRLFPVGGFVSMEGESENSEDENAFCNKKPWKRIIIIVAGATMNLILGLIIFAVLLSGEELIGTNTVAKFADNATSCVDGLKVGDTILKINGTRVFTDSDLGYCLTRDGDSKIDILVKRDGEKVLLEGVEFTTTQYEGQEIVVRDFYFYGVEKTPWRVIKQSFIQTVSTENMVRLSLIDLVTGKYGIKDLSGPIGTMEIIADAATDAASGTQEERSDGMYFLLYIMAFITINIGVVNLMPIPALDGGRLFFLIIEALRGKPILPKYENYVHAGGLVLLLVLIAVISVKDVIGLFG